MTTPISIPPAADTDALHAASPFLRDWYAPVPDEIDAVDLPVEGVIPAALEGAYVRNGPNQMFAPVGRYHVFDGDGMLHGIWLGGGRALHYRNRWVRTAGLEVERREGRAIWSGLAEVRLPDPEFMTEAGPFKNAANTSVVRHADRLLALWEGGLPTEFDDALGTVGVCDFDGTYSGSFSAHPKVDPVTGDMYTFGYSPMPPYLTYHVIGQDGRVRTRRVVDIPKPVMMHDFAVTEHFAVFLDAPAVFDMMAALNGGSPVTWQPDNGCRIGLLPRDGSGDAVWYEIDPCSVFHFLNAYEDGDRVVVDLCRAERLQLGFVDDRPEAVTPSFPFRYVIDRSTGTVTCEQTEERPADFPRIDDRYAAARHTHGWYAGILGDGTFGEFDSVIHHAFASGARDVFRLPDGWVTGEAAFAPDPDGGQGEGWVCSIVIDRPNDTSHLLILDARDVAAGPVARVQLPRRVPFGFHGSWFEGLPAPR